RRTRNAEKHPAKLLPNDTASPKRKDIKYSFQDNDDHTATVQLLNNTSANFCNEPMKLRGGRVKTSDISNYLQKKDNVQSTANSTCPVQSEEQIDIVKGNVCNALEIQILDTNNTIPTVSDIKPNLVETRTSNNNNIFLQEPVLHLNFTKVSSPSSRTLKMMHGSFLTKQDIQSDLFSTPSQPKINSYWKEVTLSSNKKYTENEGHTTVKTIEQHILDLSKPTQVTQIDSTTTAENLLHDEENSCDSGDSGVVILSGTDSTTTAVDHTSDRKSLSTCTDDMCNSETRKKPATPHRILCPSPAKNAIIYLQSPPGLLNNSSSDKNRSKRRTEINKSRKRLVCIDVGTENPPEEKQTGSQDAKPEQNNLAANKTPNSAAEMELKKNMPQQNRQLVVGLSNTKSASGCNKKITEFYPIRRSVRKTKKEVQVERDRDIERAIREEREEGLKIEYFEGKGRGIVTTRPFMKGEFVVEYIGDLISVAEAKQREQIYSKDDNTGCYIIDATAESGKFGRLVNHSRNGNLITKTVPINNRPHLVLIAKEDIEKGVEVTYDYGDRSKEALQHYPWLAL
uniref:[histone H4]-lysine(20) N-methyltransferase n=1 Tax=Anopheles epiroticus TaxID=199890 RepID=A0A182PDH9_9DIPT